MSYNNFELDFVERTMHNLQEIEELSKNIYEFTNLLNQCYGLLIVPGEFAKRRGLISNMNKHLDYYGFKKEQSLRFDADKLTIPNLLRHLRNGLAHGRIEVLDYDNGTIAGIKIWLPSISPKYCRQERQCEFRRWRLYQRRNHG